MKAYVGIADTDGLRSLVPEGDVSDGLMNLEAKTAQDRGWACFWAALDEQTADQIAEELAAGRRRDALNLLWVLARDIIRYPGGGDTHEAGSTSASPRAFAVPGCGSDGQAAGVDA